ncbi:MAG TPA: peptidylprolyl isomerase [Candidatus Baltobacteraceae bacterium]|nr:peptidylprolyl isomerase [Candidatus Baltobacteraceae bacterium]
MSKLDRVVAGLAAMLLAASLSACAGGGAIATVNGQQISKADFDAKLEASPVAASTLQQMVREILLRQYAQKNNINVTDAEITQREDQLKTNFPPGQWDEMLKSRGLTEDDVHKILTDQIIIDQAVGKNVNVSNAAIEAYFKKNHAAFDVPAEVDARHILVADLTTANKVEADLKKGANFATEAEKYSIDPGSRDKGGELGMFRRGQMTPAFDKAAFSLPVGQISTPVKSPFGYHIIQVEKRIPGQVATLANTRGKIADMLREQQEAPLIQPFLMDLQNKAQITVSDPRFAAAFPTPEPTPPAQAPVATPAASSSP